MEYLPAEPQVNGVTDKCIRFPSFLPFDLDAITRNSVLQTPAPSNVSKL